MSMVPKGHHALSSAVQRSPVKSESRRGLGKYLRNTGDRGRGVGGGGWRGGGTDWDGGGGVERGEGAEGNINSTSL